MKQLKIALAALCLLAAAPLLKADDAEGRELLKEATSEFKAKEFYDAANTALDAEHMADSAELKASAVKLAVNSFRKAELYYREFENIEKLLTSYASHIDFPAYAAREFELGDKFYEGHRDPGYYALRWVPWLRDVDRSIEIYEKALLHAPYSERAPKAKLRMAERMLEAGGVDMTKPLDVLRGVVRDYPDTPEARSAQLHLGVALASMAKYGDGDGAYNREAIQVLNEFKLRYPDAKETPYVDMLIRTTRDIQAERLLAVAKFYSDGGRQEAAERYLGEVVRLYPDSTSADSAERLLTEMDKTYIPQPVAPTVEPRVLTYDAMPIPPSGGELLITPQQSDGKYLVPVRDLGLDKNTEKK